MEMEKQDYQWLQALEQADSTGDLRGVLKLLISGGVVPEWIVEELAHLFALRRLHAKRDPTPEQRYIAYAHEIYRSSKNTGQPANIRFDLVSKNLGLSEGQQASLRNLIDGVGRPSESQRRMSHEVEELERSLRELLKNRDSCA